MRERWLATLRWGALVTAWFALVYGGADRVTAHRSLRIPVHTTWELGLPLRPEWVAAYMSIYLISGGHLYHRLVNLS